MKIIDPKKKGRILKKKYHGIEMIELMIYFYVMNVQNTKYLTFPGKLFSCFILALCLVNCSATRAQATIYRGTSSYTSDILCHVKDGKVYLKNSSYTSDIACHISNDRIYKGTSSYTSDILYTIKDGKVYRGTSSYTSDIVMTIRDSKIYKGTSTYTSYILANIIDGKVYDKTSSYTCDILFTIKGDLTIEELVGVWWMVKGLF
jgi:hypothetical protein